MTLVLRSDSFKDGEPLDRKHTCDGEGVSPALDWVGASENTKSFALIVHDPDAPSGDFTHWLLYDIPASVTVLDEAQPQASTPDGTTGKNGKDQLGYYPACPPPGDGMHRYMFEIYALNVEKIGLGEGASRQEVERAIGDHIVDQGHIEATYQRK